MAPLLGIFPACQYSFAYKKEPNNHDTKICTSLLSEDLSTFTRLNTNARRGAMAVLYFSPQPSSLAVDLIKYLGPADITVIITFHEDQLWSYLNEHSSEKISCLIIEMNSNIEKIISRCHTYKMIRSILIHCREHQLTQLKRYTRPLVKVDGIYTDKTRILIKLVLDLTFIFEEMGDEERQDRNNELEARQHYDRALKLCDLVKYL